MKSDRKSTRQKLDRSLALYKNPSEEEVRSAVDRIWQKIEPAAQTTLQDDDEAEAPRVRRAPGIRRPAWAGLAAVAVLAVLSIVIARIVTWQRVAPAIAETATGGLQRVIGKRYQDVRAGQAIAFDELLRSNGDAVFVLKDGSRIEIRSKSELLLERAEDGVRIRLTRGSVTVNAAKQRGRLYVQTKDVAVAVTGTIFIVNTEEAGSSVAVIEGEVQVRLGATSRQLRKGEEVATLVSLNPATGEVVQLGQSQVTPEFEVASIRQSTFPNEFYFMGYSSFGVCNPRRKLAPTGNRLALEKMTLCSLIASAYEIQSFRIVGAPDWMMKREPSIYYDLEARTEAGSLLTEDQAREMLKTLLADRFQLKLHPEKRELPVYGLVIAKGGPKLNSVARGPCANRTEGFAFGPGLLAGCGQSTSMAELAQLLTRETDRPVVDRTGLTGKFAFELQWTHDGNPIYSGLVEEQLGLKLEPQTAEVEVLVIDRAERPSEN